ncbi:class E sortase [Streptosporangiaceae bacterium NEAU-GS5]|nr:class E sortase [Streptosporangiaceae bacterium NEAU-GS5]
MRLILRTFGELSVTLGLVLLLFCAYLLWGTSAYTERQQRILQRQLAEEAAHPDTEDPDKPLGKVQLGRALALLTIPRLGADYRYAIVEGVDADSLRRGPGHYPGTAQPGEIGNFVISGHRTTYAAPFNRIDELRTGDDIIVDTREKRYVYEVTQKKVVDPQQLDVIDAVPERPGVFPHKAVITLTTCHPEYSARERLVVYGALTTTEDREV